MTLLELEDLTVRYDTDEGAVHAVEGVSLRVDRGQTVGLVGESGCGKTTLGRAVLGLLDDNGRVERGHAWFDGVPAVWAADDGTASRAAIEDDDIPVRADGMTDLAALSGDRLRSMRWDRVSLIPQSAMNALNPVYRVGDQIVEAIRLHEPGTSESEARDRARALLERVGVDPGRADDYAHELSGGMRQRAVIAMAMACEPDLVIADEPTTALDVIVQDRVLDALTDLQEEFGVSMLVISHDVHVIAETCDRVGVMYGGRLMEAGTATEVFQEPTNPYTLGLLNAVPRADADRDADLVQIPGTSPPLLDPPDECVFADRCPFAVEACTDGHPPTYDVAAGVEGQLTEVTDDRHRSACYRLLDVDELREAAGEDETWR